MPDISIQNDHGNSLRKRIKRHLVGRQLAFFATATPGLETVTGDELARLSPTVQVAEVIRGGAAFRGRLTDLYRANLHLFTAGRVLLRLVDFKATNFLQLRKRVMALPWQFFMAPGTVPGCKVRAHRSRLYHSEAIGQQIGETIAEYWRMLDCSPAADDRQTLYVRLDQDRVNLSLDGSGANLYRRGIKTHSTRAPLRETTAAAILQLAGYRPDRPLCDPMCGAGTFSLEAALKAKNAAPGSRRSFPFLQWPSFQPRQWEYLLKQAAGGIERLAKPLIWASDIELSALEDLHACVAQSNLEDAVVVERRDFFKDPTRWSEVGGPPGLIVLNPPYGRRLQPDGPLTRFYQRLAVRMRSAFPGWHAAVIVPERTLGGLFPFCRQVHAFEHGGLRLYLLAGTIP